MAFSRMLSFRGSIKSQHIAQDIFSPIVFPWMMYWPTRKHTSEGEVVPEKVEVHLNLHTEQADKLRQPEKLSNREWL